MIIVMHIYLWVSGTTTVAEVAAGERNNNIQVVCKKCVPFTDWISKINNTKIDTAKDIDVLMPIFNLLEYPVNHSKKSRSSWQYYRDKPGLTDAGGLDNVLGNSASFKYKQKITISTGNDSTKVVKVMVPLKYLSSFWITYQMLLMNGKIDLILTWSMNYVISNTSVDEDITFSRVDTKLYVPVVTLLTQYNAELL